MTAAAVAERSPQSMEDGVFPTAHGERAVESTRHRLPVHVAESLRWARADHAWSYRRAGREAGVAHSHVWALEHAQRAPSYAVAEAVIRSYRLTRPEADALLQHAQLAGRSSPWRNA